MTNLIRKASLTTAEISARCHRCNDKELTLKSPAGKLALLLSSQTAH